MQCPMMLYCICHDAFLSLSSNSPLQLDLLTQQTLLSSIVILVATVAVWPFVSQKGRPNGRNLGVPKLTLCQTSTNLWLRA